MPGLERRARRVKRGEYIRHPKNVDEALDFLFEAYDCYLKAGSDEEFEIFKGKFIKLCKIVGTFELRACYRKAQHNWKQRFVEEHGEEALREWRRQNTRRYREKKKKNGLVQVIVNYKAYWVKPEEVEKYKAMRKRTPRGQGYKAQGRAAGKTGPIPKKLPPVNKRGVRPENLGELLLRTAEE